jgi:hypothetical protein
VHFNNFADQLCISVVTLAELIYAAEPAGPAKDALALGLGACCYRGCSSGFKSACRDTSRGFWRVPHSWFKVLFDSGVNPDDVSIVAVEQQYG